MTAALEYAYGYVASISLRQVETPVVPMDRTDTVWYDTIEKAEAERVNDLRFRGETFIIARPKVKWFRVDTKA